MPRVVRLICVAFSLLIFPVPSYALTPGQVFTMVKDSVVVVRTLDAQGKVKSMGSGVLLPSGKVATNCHVVEGGASYRVSRGKQIVTAILYAEDSDKDICLLDAKGVKGKPVQFGKASSLKVGDPVYAVGAPQALELSLSDGIVAQLRGGPPPFIQTTAAISPGSSGGGLFDGEGRLVGLTTFLLEGGQNLNFAMPVEWIGEVTRGRKIVAEGHKQTEWLKRALALEALKDWQGLLDWGKDWTKSEPNNDVAWYCLGMAYGNLNRTDDAIAANRRTIQINPKSDDAWYNLGIAYGNLKRYDDSKEALRQSILINPGRYTAWNALGIVLGNLNRHDDEIKVYRQAILINPNIEDAWYNLGLVYGKQKRFNDSIEAFRQVVRINPEQDEAWYSLGVLYGELNRYDDAIMAYQQALRINPKEKRAWYNLGIDYVQSGNRPAAMNAMNELRRLDPEMADKLFNYIVPR